MEIPEELARAAHEHKKAAGRNAAVDDLTTAIMTGASPAEIARLEASTPGPDDGQGYDQDDSNEGREREAGDLPPNEPRNAERIRLTGLEERDKGLVNAANIIARTERIPFDEAWRRVKGDVSPGHSEAEEAMFRQGDDSAQAQAGSESQHDSDAHDEALKQHHLQLAGDLYADLKNPGSEHWREANRIATDPSHPDHDPDVLAKPHAALIIAKLAAANLGLRGAGAGDRGPGRQPGGIARPAAATKQSAPPLPGKSKTEIARASEQAALDAIEGNTPPIARKASRGYLRL